MERRLFAIMTIGAVATLAFGAAHAGRSPAYLAMPWLHVKLLLVALLIGYHGYCYRLNRAFRADRNAHTAKWYRGVQ